MRQPVVLLAAAALLAGGAAVIVFGGEAVRIQAGGSPATTAGTQSGEPPPADAVQKRISTERPAFRGKAERQAAARGVQVEDETTAAAPDITKLERVGPRPALGDVGPASPPRPPLPGERKPTMLPRPVATSAGTLEAMGYSIAIAGVEPVGVDETCAFAGTSWPCGMRARAAFRAWLRGRSVSCEVPSQPAGEAIAAPCLLGKEDVAAWLVENGWVRATAGGPYADLGEVAVKAGRGIYGAPPAMTAPAQTAAGSELPAPPTASEAILSPPGTEDLAAPEAGPVAPMPPSGPLGAFPPAPAPPPAPAE